MITHNHRMGVSGKKKYPKNPHKTAITLVQKLISVARTGTGKIRKIAGSKGFDSTFADDQLIIMHVHVCMNYSSSLKKAISQQVQHADRALHALRAKMWCLELPFDIRMHLFSHVISPILITIWIRSVGIRRFKTA